MTNVTLKGMPQGNADLHYAARVEPQRQGLLSRPAPLQSVAVGNGTVGNYGEVTFNLTDGIEYVVFGSDNKGRNVLAATTQVSTL